MFSMKLEAPTHHVCLTVVCEHNVCAVVQDQPAPAIEEDLDVLHRTLARDLVSKGDAVRSCAAAPAAGLQALVPTPLLLTPW